VKFVGWDWASTTHDITVPDQAGGIVDRWACEHAGADLAQALHRLSQHGQPSTLPMIIERTSGLVIDRLLAAGHPVVPVHPRPLPRRPSPRQTQPPHHPHRGPLLDPRHLGLLAHQPPYHPLKHTAEQRATTLT
jgi:hypothetical protein